MERWIKLITRFLVAFLHVLSSRMEGRYMPLFLPVPSQERVNVSILVLAMGLLLLVVVLTLLARV